MHIPQLTPMDTAEATAAVLAEFKRWRDAATDEEFDRASEGPLSKLLDALMDLEQAIEDEEKG